MSLLLDALKRAEDAKRAKKSDSSHLEPTSSNAAESQAQADLSLENLHEPLHVQPGTVQTPSPKISSNNVLSEPSAGVAHHRPLSLMDEATQVGAVETRDADLSIDTPTPIGALAPSGTRTPSGTRKPSGTRTNTPANTRMASNQAAPSSETSARSRQNAQVDWSMEELADLSAAQESMQRDVAKNVFAAKQNSKKISATSRPAKWLLPVIAFALVAIGAGGWYVWNQVTISSRSAYVPTVSRASDASPNSGAPAAAPAGNSVAAKSAGVAPVISTTELALPPLLPPPAKEIPLPKLASTRQIVNGPTLTEREFLAKRLIASSATRSAKEAPVSLRLSQTIEPPKINPVLLAAYTALGRGDYAQAKQRYTEVAQAEPFNLDAQLGLATAAARTGDNPTAARHYRRALEIDPRNSSAISGLLAVSGDVKPESLEVELKTLISKTPDSASLQFSLGNLYASQKRWTEAQQAYFEAYRIDSTSADYLYNLAVSLDQLNQIKLALDYYQKALVQSGKTGGQFDRASVQRRIGELTAASKAS